MTQTTNIILINSQFTTDEHLKKCMIPHNQEKDCLDPLSHAQSLSSIKAHD